MAERPYKYRREDFGELPVRLDHLTIYLNFLDGRVEASNCLDMTAKWDLDRIELDARDLEMLEVQWRPGSGQPGEEAIPLEYDYLREKNKLAVRLGCTVTAGERFRICTKNNCFPSDHILEGIYKDTTPPGAPQQYISQCQQWGFQRIMPILDDCRAKCTVTTTIEADAAYTHLISNGNISLEDNPEGKPKPLPGKPGRQIITYRNPVPMAPYLFVVCAGTWDALVDRVTYASGRSVRLEYLVPPGTAESVKVPMEILKKSVLWIDAAQDYEYTGDTYRTICMNKSNFGGMENVGNTTIVTDAALIHEHTLDLGLLYAHAVIVHEFEHNQCGSETTMATPFDVWLNEAYTVDVERQFMGGVFESAFVRLNQLDAIRNPLLGPLAIEDGGHAGRIVREGFNDPDELIDGVTYVKAAEVIRMLRLLLGAEKFKEAKALYFSRYKHANADTDQFFECFEEVSGASLAQFKKEWLYRIGYPKVTAKTSYDAGAKEYWIDFHQELRPGEAPFELPVQLALVDPAGKDIPGTARVFALREKTSRLVFNNIGQVPAFASINRDYSFYGTFRNESASPGVLAIQTRLDPNPYCRVDAMRQLTDIERIRLLQKENAAVSSSWLGIYGEILADPSLPSALKAHFLRIDEQPLDRAYSTWFPELVRARDKLKLAVNRRYRDELIALFGNRDTYTAASSLRAGIEERMLKHTLLELIAADDSEESHRIVLDHFRRATAANDRVSALTMLNRSSAPERLEVLEEVYRAWSAHLSGYANYLRVVSSGTRPDVFDMIEKERRRPGFDITQPTWCRALFLTMAGNNRMIWDDRGIGWIADRIIELAPINMTNAARMLNTFQHVRLMKPELRDKVAAALDRIVRGVGEDVCPAVHRQAAAYREMGEAEG